MLPDHQALGFPYIISFNSPKETQEVNTAHDTCPRSPREERLELALACGSIPPECVCLTFTLGTQCSP